MFVALYEFTIKAGEDERFRSAWLKTTQGIYKHCGSLGSRLHATGKPNVYVGYAQWPTEAQWVIDQPDLLVPYADALADMRACIETFKLIHEMQVTDDYLQTDIYSVINTSIDE